MWIEVKEDLNYLELLLLLLAYKASISKMSLVLYQILFRYC